MNANNAAKNASSALKKNWKLLAAVGCVCCLSSVCAYVLMSGKSEQPTAAATRYQPPPALPVAPPPPPPPVAAPPPPKKTTKPKAKAVVATSPRYVVNAFGVPVAVTYPNTVVTSNSLAMYRAYPETRWLVRY